MRYLVIPIGDTPAERYAVGRAIRAFRTHSELSVQEQLNLTGLRGPQDGLIEGDPLPDEFTHPLISPDVDPEASGILSLLMMSPKEQLVHGEEMRLGDSDALAAVELLEGMLSRHAIDSALSVRLEVALSRANKRSGTQIVGEAH